MSLGLNSLVTVIVINYNYAQYLRQALESVLRQDHPDVEIIVVDDASTDHSGSVLKEYESRVQVIYQDQNAGACAARNRGLAAAAGAFVKFLDADDWLAPGCLSKQVRASIAFSPQARISVFGDALWVNGEGDALNMKCAAPSDGEADLVWMISNNPLTSCPLHRRRDLELIGGFDPAVLRSQEHDLHLRLLLDGVRFIHHRHVCYSYRQHNAPGRISLRNTEAVGRSVLLASRRHILLAETRLGSPLPMAVRRAFAKHLWRNGREYLRNGARLVAEEFFVYARQIYPKDPAEGRSAYRLLARYLGPRVAESVIKFRFQRGG